MSRPDRRVTIHKCYFENQARRVLSVINLLTEKDSLNTDDVQAVKELIVVYEELVNLPVEKYTHHQAGCDNNHCEKLQE